MTLYIQAYPVCSLPEVYTYDEHRGPFDLAPCMEQYALDGAQVFAIIKEHQHVEVFSDSFWHRLLLYNQDSVSWKIKDLSGTGRGTHVPRWDGKHFVAETLPETIPLWGSGRVAQVQNSWGNLTAREIYHKVQDGFDDDPIVEYTIVGVQQNGRVRTYKRTTHLRLIDLQYLQSYARRRRFKSLILSVRIPNGTIVGHAVTVQLDRGVDKKPLRYFYLDRFGQIHWDVDKTKDPTRLCLLREGSSK